MGFNMATSPDSSHSNDELVSPEEVNDFMLKIGYVKMNAVKDHREVTRFEDPSHELQNISVPLAVLLTMRFKAYASQCRKEAKIELCEAAILAGPPRLNPIQAGAAACGFIVNTLAELKKGDAKDVQE